MPSHLLRLVVCAIFLSTFLAVCAEKTKIERAKNETQPKLTTTNRVAAENSAVARITEKSDDKGSKKAGAQGRRIYTARLYGSLCVSCLKHLNDDLNKKTGIFESTIDRAVKKEAHDGEPTTYQRWANAKVVYDASKLSKDDITKRMRQSDFIVRRVEDLGESELSDAEPGETSSSQKR